MKKIRKEEKSNGSRKAGSLGVVLIAIAVLASVYGQKHVVPLEMALVASAGLYLGTLVLRILFLKLSARILSLGQVSFGRAIEVVGANAAFTVVLASLISRTGISGVYVTSSLAVLAAFFAFVVAHRAFRISWLETLALYALSLAFMVVAFCIIVLVFHPSIGTFLGGM